MNIFCFVLSMQNPYEVENPGNSTYSCDASPPCYADAIRMPKPTSNVMCNATTNKTSTAMLTSNPFAEP